ncbi:hypothetical protein KM043_004271 [Ampulex compressa]|nr:hypothetical protein KM043_004271 [Ampulex compressa]
MTKKARKALEKEQAASAIAEEERIRDQLIKDMQEEIRLEKYNEERRILLDEEQASLRKVQLEETWFVLYDYKRAFTEHLVASEEEEHWTRYMTCDGLPDPGSLSDMNTYAFLWTMEDEKASMNTIAERCDIVIYLLTKLNEIVRYFTTTSPVYIAECEAVGRDFRRKLQQWIDTSCYRLLRRIERNMVRENTKTASYVHRSDRVICCIWVLIKLPIGTKKVAEKDRKPIEVQFEELDLAIKMPSDVDCYCMAIRGLWLKYDHYSDEANSYVMPQLPEEYIGDMDLLSFCQKEYEERLKIREGQLEGRRLRLEEKKALLERMENPPPPVVTKSDKRGKRGKKAGTQFAAGKGPEVEPEPEPLPYLPTPDEIIRQGEEEAKKEIKRLLFTRCEKTEINLRKYRILGGVFHLDLVYQPPQPKETTRKILLTSLQIPKELKFVPFFRPYKAPPPAPDSERTPEVIEAEMKALETAMEALALVTLKLPAAVLWFEPPLVAHWLPDRRIWSTQDIHDIKYNEEKQTIAFRTGRMGIHGLAAYKFLNLPFQCWELKPEMGRNARGGVALNITAATVQAEFVVREDLICLNSLTGGSSPGLKAMIGEYMKLHLLIEKMQGYGCDLFPERDAYSYTKKLPMKHRVTEKHLQECMGLLSTAYSFSWSRWNASRESREIVLQFKELHGCVAKERTSLTLLITPLQTKVVRCTEVSPEFSDELLDDSDTKFYADLYHLALHNAGIKSRLIMKDMSFKLALTVTKLLERTNVIGMSS